MRITEVRGDAKRITIKFDKLVDGAQAGKPENYRVDGREPLRARAVGPMVLLEINGMKKRDAGVSLSGRIRDRNGRALEPADRKFSYSPKYRRREIMVSSVQPLMSPEITGGYGGYLDYVLGLVDKAGERRPDIICLPESIQSQFDKGKKVCADTLPGAFTDIFARKAKKYGTYLILPMIEKKGKEIHNIAVLFDRSGRIAGRYQKLFVTEDIYAEPGNEAPVFETDFGKIGILVCFDLYFPEPAALLALKGAEIIFHPHGITSGEESMILYQKARALDNNVYLVSSSYGRKVDRGDGAFGRSSVIDKNGLVIADLGYKDGVLSSFIDLEDMRIVYGYGRDWRIGPADCGDRRRRERRPDLYEQLLEELHKQADGMWFVERGYWKKKDRKSS
jgi:predicted amidohydrolase